MLQRWFLLVFLCLSGCIETAFVAGATTGGLVVYDRRDFQTALADQELHHQAFVQISSDRSLVQPMHVVIAAFNRIVLITGQVPDEPTRHKVLQNVQVIPGIKRVYSELTVAPNTSTLVRSKDTLITTTIKGKLLLENGLKSSQIKVVTENGTVYLLGIVGHHQEDIAVNIARNVQGVRRVVKLFEYVTPGDL